MPKTDVIIEVLDARIPYSSPNPLLAELRGNKPCLKVLAKSDLADEAMTLSRQEYLKQSPSVRGRIATTEDISTIRSLKNRPKHLPSSLCEIKDAKFTTTFSFTFLSITCWGQRNDLVCC